jgi:hypothetical protein
MPNRHLTNADRGAWWECKNAHAAMWAPAESGVEFRKWVGVSGAVDRWHAPKLADWEVPRADPSERRPWKWDVAEQRRIAARRRREVTKARQAEPPTEAHREGARQSLAARQQP